MKKIILVTVMLICAALLSVALAPSLWSDAKLRNQELTQSSSGFIDTASCKTRIVVSFCQITTRGSGFPVFYLITGLGSNETVTAMVPKPASGARTASASAAVNPSQGFTTNIGMTYFWNRVATFLAALGVSLGLAIAAMMGWIRGL